MLGENNMIARLLRARAFDIEVTNHCNVDCVFCPRKEIPEFGLLQRSGTVLCRMMMILRWQV